MQNEIRERTVVLTGIVIESTNPKMRHYTEQRRRASQREIALTASTQ